jgi:hypothetical protein
MSIVLLPAPEYRAVTLDDLWAEAETLGHPKLERESFGKRYRASIYFTTKHGTCFAKGEHDSPHCALGDAINNARQLGAGESV